MESQKITSVNTDETPSSGTKDKVRVPLKDLQLQEEDECSILDLVHPNKKNPPRTSEVLEEHPVVERLSSQSQSFSLSENSQVEFLECEMEKNQVEDVDEDEDEDVTFSQPQLTLSGLMEILSESSDDDDGDVVELDSVAAKRPCQVAFLDEEGRKMLQELRENDVPRPKNMGGCAQIIAQSVFAVLKTSGEEFRQWGLEKLKGDDEEGAAQNFMDKMANLIEQKEEADRVAADAASSSTNVRKRRRRRGIKRSDGDSDNPLDLTICSEDLVPEIRLLLDQESESQ